MNLLNVMTKRLQSKEFDTRFSSVEGQCANYYPTELSVIAIICFLSVICLCIIAFVGLVNHNTVAV